VQLGVDPLYGRYLAHTYGKQAEIILDKMENSYRYDGEKGLILSELWYCVHYEMVYGSADFFVRRTGRLFFDIDSVKEFSTNVIEELKQYFQWEDDQVKREFEIIEKIIYDATNYYEREISGS